MIIKKTYKHKSRSLSNKIHNKTYKRSLTSLSTKTYKHKSLQSSTKLTLKNNNNLLNYKNYIINIKKHLETNLFNIQLLPLDCKPIKINNDIRIKHAYNYYKHNKNKLPLTYNISPLNYKINNNTTIKYSAYNNQNTLQSESNKYNNNYKNNTNTNKYSDISIGTFYLDNKPQIVNFYQCNQKYNNNTNNKKKYNIGINTYRFGTPVIYFNNVNEIIKNILYFEKKKKKIICISLLSPCDNIPCKTLGAIAKPLSKISSLFKKGLNATKEQNIIDIEQKANINKFDNNIELYSIIFPLSSQRYSGVGSKILIVNINTYNYNKTKYKSFINNNKVNKIYDFIDINNDLSGEKSFKSIVKIAIYYFTYLKNEYILSYHCKSGKDRTSIYDAITQSTFYYLNTNKFHKKQMKLDENIDIDETIFINIKQLSKQFLIYGLIIAYNSTSIVGLKLKNIPIAKYIFNDSPDLLSLFIGHSKLILS